MEILFTKHWNLYFEFFSEEQYDIYFKEEYVYLYKSTTEEPCCLVIHEGNFYMLFPFTDQSIECLYKSLFQIRIIYINATLTLKQHMGMADLFIIHVMNLLLRTHYLHYMKHLTNIFILQVLFVFTLLWKIIMVLKP